jgi:hypothetical protein
LPTGTAVIPCIWSMILLTMIIIDLVRLRHILAGRFYSHTNHLDLTWHAVSTFTIPPLITCTALQLGVDDLYMIVIILVCALFAGVCDIFGEELFLLYTKEFYLEQETLRTDLTLTMGNMYILLITTSLLVTTFPTLFKPVPQDYSTPLLHWLLIFFMFKLVILLISVQLSNHRLYKMLQKTRSDHRGLLAPMITNENFVGKLNNYHGMIQTEKGVSCGWNKTRHQHIKSTEEVPDPFDVDTSEKVFNQIYGCHLYNEYYIDTSVSGCNNLVTFTDRDGDGNGTQCMVGMLVEWRRHYLLSMIINMMLVCILLQLTGVEISL